MRTLLFILLVAGCGIHATPNVQVDHVGDASTPPPDDAGSNCHGDHDAGIGVDGGYYEPDAGYYGYDGGIYNPDGGWWLSDAGIGVDGGSYGVDAHH